MKRFSERIGKKPIKEAFQIESMDDDLRNGLWNGVTLFFLDKISESWIKHNSPQVNQLVYDLWVHYFKERYDELPSASGKFKEYLKEYFFEKTNWYEVYDLIEFLAKELNNSYWSDFEINFSEFCNSILKKELSGYRFINYVITPITSEQEIDSLEMAMESPDIYDPVKEHLNEALNKLSDRTEPDYRNSIKESVSAVEAYCKLVTGDSKATLGKALKKIKEKFEIHPALEQAFDKLYGYASDEGGIRHSLLEEDNLKQEDARFMLVACSAFINYMTDKMK